METTTISESPKLINEDIRECTDIYEVMEKGKLNFVPVQQEVITLDGIPCPEHKAIYRNDTKEVLSVMGKGYSFVTPVQSFSFVDNIVKENDLEYSKVRAINNGRKISVIADSKDFIDLGKGDFLKKQIVFTDSFDGTSGLKINFQLMRSLCSNCEIWKSEHTQMLSLRHTKSINDRLGQSVNIWNKSKSAFAIWQEKIEYLNQKIINHEQIEKMLNNLLDVKDVEKISTRKFNQKEKITNLFHNGKGNHGETAWDLYNGVTEYYDHYSGTDSDKVLISANYGNGANQKSKAFDLALSM